MKNTKLFVSYVHPANNKGWLESLALKPPDLLLYADDYKAQKLDSLSSIANIGGYRADLEAFQYFEGVQNL